MGWDGYGGGVKLLGRVLVGGGSCGWMLLGAWGKGPGQEGGVGWGEIAGTGGVCGLGRDKGKLTGL